MCTNRSGTCGRSYGNDRVTYCRRVEERNPIAVMVLFSVTFSQHLSIKYVHSSGRQNCTVPPDCYWHMASRCLWSDFDKSCLRGLGATKWKCHLHYFHHPSSAQRWQKLWAFLYVIRKADGTQTSQSAAELSTWKHLTYQSGELLVF